MAEAANVAGTIDIPVRAKLDALERDLASVRQRLERFDTATVNSTRQLENFEDASEGAAAALGRQERELAATQARTTQLTTANSQVTVSYRDLVAAMSSVQAANENVSRSTREVSAQAAGASRSFSQMGQDAVNSGKSFFQTGAEILKWAGYAKLAATVAYAASPALRSIVTSGLTTWTATAVPMFDKLGRTMSAVTPQFVKTNSAVAGFVPAIKGAHDTLKPFMKVADGLEIVQLASAFPLAAAGAAALSPALRQVATKEVVGGLQALGPAISTVAPAAKTAAGAILTALGPALAFAAKITIPIIAAISAWKLLEFTVVLASQRIEKSMKLVQQSMETGLSTDFLQRAELSVKKLGVSIDSMVGMAKKFNEASKTPDVEFSILEAGKERGDRQSIIQKRLNELEELGNFLENPFVIEFREAGNAEARYRAIVGLITTAMQQGERLAALNLASTFLPPEMLDRLRAMPEFLQVAQEQADKIASKEILSPEEIARAVALKNQLDEAYRILNERWIPAEKQLAEIGMIIKGIWASILTTVVKAITFLTDGLMKTVALIDRMVTGISKVGRAMTWQDLPESKNIEDRRPGMGMPNAEQMTAARQQLAAMLVQQGSVRRAQAEMMDTFKDVSKLQHAVDWEEKYTDGLKKLAEAAGDAGREVLNSFRLSDLQKLFEGQIKALDSLGLEWDEYARRLKETTVLYQAARENMSNNTAWDKELQRITKQIGANNAAAVSMGRQADFQERLRVESALLNVATVNGTKVTQEQIDKYVALRGTMTTQQALTAAGINLEGQMARAFEETGRRAGEASLALKQMTAARALDREAVANAISMQALTAFSPGARGEIAYRQKINELQEKIESREISLTQAHIAATQARNLALRGEVVQIEEAQRARELAARQATRSAQVEISMIDKSVGAQYRLQTIEAARQQLEQEAATKRIPFDQAKLDALTREINKTAELKQAQAQLNAQADANFALQTVFLSDLDRQIATVQRQLHGDNWRNFMNDGLAATMRLTEAFRQLESAATSFVSGFFTDISRGVKATDALANSLRRLADQLINMISQQLVKQALGGLAGPLSSGLGSLFGVGGGGGAVGSGLASAGAGIVAHSGGIVGQTAFSKRMLPPGFFNDAIRFHLGSNEVPAILEKGEKIIPKGGAFGGTSVTVGGSTIIVQGDASEKTLALMEQKLAQRDRQLPSMVLDTMAQAKSRRISR